MHAALTQNKKKAVEFFPFKKRTTIHIKIENFGKWQVDIWR